MHAQTADVGAAFARFARGEEIDRERRHRNDIIDFAEKYLVNERGEPIRISRTPVVVGIYDAMLNFSGDATVVAITKAAQVGLTQLAMNCLMYWAYADRAQIHFMMEDEKKVEGLALARLRPNLTRYPLRGFIERELPVGTKGSMYRLSYEGGGVSVSGSNSTSAFSSRPAQYIIADEYAKWRQSVGGQNRGVGSPLPLLRGRLQGQGSRTKILICSTPTSPADTPGSFYNIVSRGGERQFFMPCIHCGFHHAWSHETFRMDPSGDKMEAWHECPGCGGKQYDKHKPEMMNAPSAEWRDTIARPKHSDITSFRLPSFYSTAPAVSWVNIAKRKYDAENDNDGMREFTNEILGDFYDDGIKPPPPNEVRDKFTLPIKRGTAPSWACMLTLGADIQGDYVSWSVYAWSAEGLHSCLVETGEIDGNIGKHGVRERLRRTLYRRFPVDGGGTLPVLLGAFDCGWIPHEVLDFISGLTPPHKPQSSRSPVWRVQSAPCGIGMRGSRRGDLAGVVDAIREDKSFVSRSNNKSLHMIYAGGSPLKDGLYRALGRERTHEDSDPVATAERQTAFFADGFEPRIFDEIVSEEKVTRYTGNVAKTLYEKTAKKNEKLDCYVYAACCAHMLGLASKRPGDLRLLRNRFWRADGDAANIAGERDTSMWGEQKKGWGEQHKGW